MKARLASPAFLLIAGASGSSSRNNRAHDSQTVVAYSFVLGRLVMLMALLGRISDASRRDTTHSNLLTSTDRGQHSFLYDSAGIITGSSTFASQHNGSSHSLRSPCKSGSNRVHPGNPVVQIADGVYEKGAAMDLQQEKKPYRENFRARRLMSERNTSIPSTRTWAFDEYATLDQYVARIFELERTFPDFVTVTNLTHTTYEGRVLHAMTINGNANLSKKILLTGLQHAREWLSGMAVMYIAETLAKELSSVTNNTSLLNQYEYLVIPVANPDGYKFTRSAEGATCSMSDQTSQKCDREWRKNRAPVSDLARCRGVDLNRNWPMDYAAHGEDIGIVGSSGSSCDDTYRGEHFFSEPETLGICEFIAQATGEPSMHLCSTMSPHAASGDGHATIAAAIDFHSFGRLVLGGWAHTSQPTPTMLKNEIIGRAMVEKMKPQVYTYGTWGSKVGGLGYLASGVLPDWLLYAFGTYAYTLELPPALGSKDGFSLANHLIPEACSTAFKAVIGMLEGLEVPLQGQEEMAYVMAPGEDIAGANCKMFNSTLKVDIKPDLYPTEISWELLHGNGMGWDVVVRWDRTRHGPATDYAGLTAHGGSIMMCIPGVYLLVIRDTFGDGLCCDSGSGGFSLSLDGQEIYDGSGDYTHHTAVIVKLDMDPSVWPVYQDTDVAAVTAQLESELVLTKKIPPSPSKSTPSPTTSKKGTWETPSPDISQAATTSPTIAPVPVASKGITRADTTGTDEERIEQETGDFQQEIRFAGSDSTLGASEDLQKGSGLYAEGTDAAATDNKIIIVGTASAIFIAAVAVGAIMVRLMVSKHARNHSLVHINFGSHQSNSESTASDTPSSTSSINSSSDDSFSSARSHKDDMPRKPGILRSLQQAQSMEMNRPQLEAAFPKPAWGPS